VAQAEGAEIRGIELSRRFYAEVVGPWLARAFAGLRHAAALIGYGSELLGFDDAMSQDHNFGPRVIVLVSPDDFAAHAGRMVAAFREVAPPVFLGHPMGSHNRPHPSPHRGGALGDDGHGLEIWTLEAAARFWLGGPEPADGLAWLGLAEQRLLALTAGAVFHDDEGRLTALRQRLAWFPRDVWLYKLACQWRRIAEEQPFVGRTGFAGDELGSRVMAGRLVRDAMRMAFLIERRYAPYSKWFGSAFARLPCAGELTPLLDRALAADAWKPRETSLAEAYAALGRVQQARAVPGAIAPRIGQFWGRPFTVINAEEMMAGLRAEIADPALRALPIIGALDQVSDSTPVIESPSRARAAMAALFDDGEAGAVEEA
jgi:hypothetical protein